MTFSEEEVAEPLSSLDDSGLLENNEGSTSQQEAIQEASVDEENSTKMISTPRDPVPDALTQKYLQLLNSGRLASKKKFELQYGNASGSLKGVVGEQQSTSVHEPEFIKMTTTASRLEGITPVSRTHSQPLGTRNQPALRNSQSAQMDRKGSPQRSSQFRQGELAMSAPVTPMHFPKIMTPGPGAYGPSTDRFGSANDSAKYSFGTARQRPSHVCIHDRVVSPGPVYLPDKTFVSTMTGSKQLRFGRQDVGSRFSMHANQPSNCPHWNPGPGDYDSLSIYKGGKTDAGADVPKTVFGKSQKLVSPESQLSATVFVSEAHAKRENASVHSPGPGIYSPREMLTKPSASSFTLAAKSASYFDLYLDPLRQTSPGPIYNAANTNYKGTKVWGDEPKTTFGRANKNWAPELNLSAAVFISHDHAVHANQTVHSPGPMYFPERSQHARAPLLQSGQLDRFYDRFEPGRVG